MQVPALWLAVADKRDHRAGYVPIVREEDFLHGEGEEVMNPKIQEEMPSLGEQNDYPRWTKSMKETLLGIQKFREVIKSQRN